jgi:hypothetical protein
MHEVGECFIESYKFCMGSYINEGKISITEFVAELVLNNKPYLLTTQEGVIHNSMLVFTNDSRRDFIFMLNYVFFSRYGHSDSDIDGLIGNIARGIAMRNKNSVMPIVLSDRLSDTNTAFNILKDNKWLVIIALIHLFITLD